MSLKSLKAELSTLQTEKRRPPADVAKRLNASGHCDPHTLYEIPLYQVAGSNNWLTLPVCAIDDEKFHLRTCVTDLVFHDDDLKPDADGKYIVDLSALELEHFYHGVELPQEFELPLEVLEKRKEKRKLLGL